MQLNSHLSVLVHEVAKHYGAKPAITFRNFGSLKWKSVSWNQFSTRVKQVSNALLNLGAKPHDTIAVFSQNCIQYLYTDFGAYGGLEQPPGHKTVPRQSSVHAKLNNNERRRRSRSSGPSNRPGRQRPTVRQQSARPQPRSSAMIATSARNSSELMQPTMPTFHQRIWR